MNHRNTTSQEFSREIEMSFQQIVTFVQVEIFLMQRLKYQFYDEDNEQKPKLFVFFLSQRGIVLPKIIQNSN